MDKLGAMVISLDFELIWGVFDKVDPSDKAEYFMNTRKVIPELLQLFRKYEISATWAIVGMLFNKNWNEWNENTASISPSYKKVEFNPYRFGRMSQIDGANECLYFAPLIIELIKATPKQEIGSHTYSHYYCLEEGQSSEEFRADLEKALDTASDFGIKLESLVFPRNQFNEDYLKICYNYGIKNVRSNPISWYWRNPQKNTLLTRIFRTGDAYIGFNSKSYDISELRKGTDISLAQKASRLLRPYSPNKLLNSLKLERIKSEMTYAAKKKKIYHLWWHPHNFGMNPRENLRDLEDLLKHFKKCQQKYEFESRNMKEINSLVNA